MFFSSGKKASIDKVKSSKVVKASLGRSAVLLCYYGGEPAPKVSWSKNGKLINDKCVKCAVKVNQNTPGVSKLQVIPFQEKDFGNYMCKVRNAIGFQQIKITLQTNDEESKLNGLFLCVCVCCVVVDIDVLTLTSCCYRIVLHLLALVTDVVCCSFFSFVLFLFNFLYFMFFVLLMFVLISRFVLFCSVLLYRCTRYN